MTPFYSRGGVDLYLGDCREVLAGMAPGSFDLMVTDPPYGVGYQSGYRAVAHKPIEGDDDASWVPEALLVACGALRKSRHAYVFGPRELLGPPLRSLVELVWDKGSMGMGDLSLPWSASHEPITFAVKNEKGRGGLPARLRSGSVLAYPRPPASRHPTEKPVALLRRLIESSSRIGESVLDPFVGCGSTMVAAVLEGRTGAGVDLDEGYLETAALRLDKALDAMRFVEVAAS